MVLSRDLNRARSCVNPTRSPAIADVRCKGLIRVATKKLG